MKKYFYSIIVIIGLASCSDQPSFNGEGKVMGYKPVYTSYEVMSKVSIEQPKKLKNPAKIYVLGNFLFVNEYNLGVHVINNSDPAKPLPVSFINIPGNQDIEIKNNVMYADNGRDLIALDLSSPESVKVLKRVEKVFPNPSYPPFQNVKFECPDESKGFITSWEFVELDSPKCFR